MISGVREGGPAALAEPALTGGDVVQSRSTARRSSSLDEFIDELREDHGRRQAAQVDPGGVRPQRQEQRHAGQAQAGQGRGRSAARGRQGLDRHRHPAGAEGPGREARQSPRGCGFRVTRIYPKTQAADSDLKVGDIIIVAQRRDVQASRHAGRRDAGPAGPQAEDRRVRQHRRAARAASRPR